MKILKNKNLKNLIIPILILAILTSVIISLQTYCQYKKLSNIINEKISNVIGSIKENNPEIDTREIVKILNSEKKKMNTKMVKKNFKNMELM